MPDILQQTVDAIKQRKNFVLSAHMDPEGDCVASLLAVDGLLRKLGKHPNILCQDPVPANMKFLDTENRWRTVQETGRLSGIEAGIIVDCPTLERTGTAKEMIIELNSFLINIDHHISNKNFGTVNFVDVKAAACGELVYDLFKAFQVPLSMNDAESIYVSLATDTGSFKYSNTRAKTHEIVADLLRQGLDLEKVNEHLYDSTPKTKLEIFKIFLNRIEFFDRGTVACAILRQDDFKRAGAAKADLEGCVEYMRSIEGVAVSFLISESGADARISFRSKGNFDVNRLAGIFGGGGHKKASGCTIHTSVEEAKKRILDQIKLAKSTK